MEKNSRAVAAQILRRVICDGQSLTTVLAEVPSNRDSALVQALCYGVSRWYFRLDFILSQLLSKPLRRKDADIRMLALIGLFQLAYSRVKTHAAVAETVAAAGRKQWAKAVLNAILRTYDRERERLEAAADASDVGHSAHPPWLLERIRCDWPEAADQIIAENNRQAPMVLRVNLGKCERQVYLRLLAESGIKAQPGTFCDSAVILEEAVDVAALPGFLEGLVAVQDGAAQLAANLLEVVEGQRVLDVCAAPGGKAVHILERYPLLAELTALDIDSERLARVGANLARSGVVARLRAGDAAKPEEWWDGQLYQRILLDAPCSATGVIRRHPDIKLLRRPDDIARLCETQQRILRAVWPLLAPDGVLLYATCSILKQENEQQILRFLGACPDAHESPIEAAWGVAREVGRQVLPGDAGMDGFYYARLVKTK